MPTGDAERQEQREALDQLMAQQMPQQMAQQMPQHQHTWQHWTDDTARHLLGTGQQIVGGDIAVTTAGSTAAVEQPMYYTYSTGGAGVLDLELVKRALREVLAELAAQDESFTAWLRMKYTTIPALTPERG